MNNLLPKDLIDAEVQLYESTILALDSISSQRLCVQLKFEGLKVEPIALRFARKIQDSKLKPLLAFSDFGSSALFKRDHPDIKDFIFTFKDIVNSEICTSNHLIIAIAPQPYNYEEFFKLCEIVPSKIVMFNGKLEDNAVGIGSVGRDRRSTFIKSWNISYYLEPLENGALLYTQQEKWKLFSYSNEGYRFIESFESRPDELLINSYLYE